MAPRVRGALFGALGGMYGAAAMSIVRLAMRRAGHIDKMVPQVVEEWIAHRTGIEPPAGAAGHQLFDQLLHLGYGAAWGGLGAQLVAGGAGRRFLWRGAALGLGLWAAGMLVALPSLKVARSAWRSGLRENATNIAAHLAYGLSVQLVTEELERQPNRQATTDAERHATRVG
jgi:hypothetical protein